MKIIWGVIKQRCFGDQIYNLQFKIKLCKFDFDPRTQRLSVV